jgi:hypothetical protein
VIGKEHQSALSFRQLSVKDPGDSGNPLSIRRSVRRKELNFHNACICGYRGIIVSYLGKSAVLDPQLPEPDLLGRGAMGANEYSGATRLCLIRQFAQGRVADRIKAVEGFVKHQESDRTQERLGKDKLLTISFGQGVDGLVGAGLEVETLEELPTADANYSCIESLDPAHVGQILRSGEPCPGGQPLGHVPDAIWQPDSAVVRPAHSGSDSKER